MERKQNMKVLAIDSSGLTASVAIVEETHTVAEYTVNYEQTGFRSAGHGGAKEETASCEHGSGETREAGTGCKAGTGGIHPVRGKKTHSQTLLPMIDGMVKMADLSLTDVDAVAVAGGPGSFTGLRIGSATAKGLGLALEKPLIHVPTLDALAYQLYGCEDIVCPVMDARRNQVYTGIYTFSREAGRQEGTKEAERVFRILEAQTVISVEELIRRLNGYGRPVILLGDGVPVYRDMFAAGLEVLYSFAPAWKCGQRAAAVGELGIRYFHAGKYESAGEHRPDYLRLSQAERERMQREKTEEVAVRRMEAGDAAAAAEIEFQSFSDAWSQKGIAESLANPQAICLAAEKSGKLIGYLFAYQAAGEAEIARIAVVKEERRKGAGRKILDALEELCRKNEVRKLLLDVRESNGEARAFYRKAGFKEDGVRRGFYLEPAEDAVLMSREIS